MAALATKTWMAGTSPAMTKRWRPPARNRRQFLFSVAFVFICDLIQTESEIAKVNWRTPGERLWIEFSTSRL
jgi:hypothetical protein